MFQWRVAVRECGAKYCQAAECSPTNVWPTTLRDQQAVQVFPLLLMVKLFFVCSAKSCHVLLQLNYLYGNNPANIIQLLLK